MEEGEGGSWALLLLLLEEEEEDEEGVRRMGGGGWWNDAAEGFWYQNGGEARACRLGLLNVLILLKTPKNKPLRVCG